MNAVLFAAGFVAGVTADVLLVTAVRRRRARRRAHLNLVRALR